MISKRFLAQTIPLLCVVMTVPIKPTTVIIRGDAIALSV